MVVYSRENILNVREQTGQYFDCKMYFISISIYIYVTTNKKKENIYIGIIFCLFTFFPLTLFLVKFWMYPFLQYMFCKTYAS